MGENQEYRIKNIEVVSWQLFYILYSIFYILKLRRSSYV